MIKFTRKPSGTLSFLYVEVFNYNLNSLTDIYIQIFHFFLSQFWLCFQEMYRSGYWIYWRQVITFPYALIVYGICTDISPLSFLTVITWASSFLWSVLLGVHHFYCSFQETTFEFVDFLHYLPIFHFTDFCSYYFLSSTFFRYHPIFFSQLLNVLH